jgi:hypothetical protein
MMSTSAIRILLVVGVLFVLSLLVSTAIKTWSPGPLPVPPPIGQIVSEPPAGIVMLPGYTFTPDDGTEVAFGMLKKDGGPSISYEVGGHHGPLVQEASSRDIVWQKHLTIRGESVDVFMFRGGELRVGSPYGNFIGRNVKSQQDVVDVLLTALSLDPDVLVYGSRHKKDAPSR